MVTEWMMPSAAARTASSPIRPPVGTRMRAPVSFARATRSQLSRSWPTLSGMNSLPRSITDNATVRNIAGGRHSTTRSQVSTSASAATIGMRLPTCGRLRRALSRSRTETAVRTRPGMPASIRRATSRPTAPSPPNPTLRASRATSRPPRSPTLAAIRPARYIPCLCAVQAPRNSPGCRAPMADKRHFMTNINPNTFTTRPEIEGTFGVVTTTHWIATAVGMGILERGGNAFDAGVATAFTLQMVEPHLNGPGGDVPVIVHDVKRGKPEVICGQGVAPAGATIAHYRSEGLDLVPGTGLLAACVPGTFETWMMLLRDYGTMSIADVLAPAIGYAQNGYPLLERANATIAMVADLLRQYWPTSAAVYLPDNIVPTTGSLFTNKTLAATYARIVKEAESACGDRVAQIERARKSWSHGFVAEAIDRFCRTQDIMDTSGHKHRGVLTADDMARWTPHIEAPLTYDYRGFTVCKTGPWGQGPVTLQQLALLKGFDLDGLDPTGPDFIHLI